MRKILLLIFAIICFQDINAQKVIFGVKGGTNLSSFNENFNSPFDFNYKFGFQIGGLARIPLTDRLLLQPELLYSLQGTNFDLSLVSIQLPQNDIDDLFAGNIENSVNESTILVPIMLKYYLSDNFNIEFGPQLDYLFSSNSSTLTLTNEGVISNYENVSEFNFGINIGVGYDFKENMGLGLRYNYGFNRLFKGDLSRFDNGFKRRNSVFSLNFEYRFN